ncbi:PREDICTED: uncharacterized protein LOC107185915 [Dufourea novaeangliae]|uniref:uncharacterized protein LOC107185915 n=1 Tax=Dufourea novaeangliae TaxID=178035 RepID=UPI0007671608|nr:PREDICTED: uncharacterized protein LOC107185915 [Dufourea novaeangliae]
MLAKLLYVFVLFLGARTICTATFHQKKHHIDIGKFNASYYDPETGVGLMPELEGSGRNPASFRIGFRGIPCQCENLECNCCVGVNLNVINFNRKACTKFTYDPSTFTLNTVLSMNEREIYTNTLSTKNPPPLCVPLPQLPIIQFCIRFFDVYTEGRNLHACIDLETRMIGSPILILHFNCVKVGVDGVSWAHIGNGTSTMSLQMQTVTSEPEVYDEVDFEQQDLEVFVNYTSTLSPDEEAQIGQLKL